MFEFNKKENLYVLIFIILAVFSIKVNVLSAPFFEDAKFFTVPIAIYTAENNFPIFLGEGIPNLLETNNPPHPLFKDNLFDTSHTFLFYYILAAIYVAFGYSVFLSHLVIVLFGILLLYYSFLLVYFLTKNFFSGFITIFLVLFNPLFFAQIGRLDIDMAVAAFIIVSIYYYLKEEPKKFLISSIIMILLKESSLLIVLALIFHKSIENVFFYFKKKNYKSTINLKLLLAPLLIFLIWSALFKLIQKSYLDYTSFFIPTLSGLTFNKMLTTITLFANFIFIHQYRFILTLAILSGLIFYKKLSCDAKKFLLLSSLIIIAHIFFFSFITQISSHFRYVLPAVILFIISASIMGDNLFKKKYLFILFGVIFLFYSVTTFFDVPKFNHEENMHYFGIIELKQEAAEFISSDFSNNYTLWVDGFTYADYSYPFIGYVSDSLNVEMIPSAEYYEVNLSIFKRGDYVLETDWHGYWQELEKTKETIHSLNLKLNKSFSAKHHYLKIYEIN